MPAQEEGIKAMDLKPPKPRGHKVLKWHIHVNHRDVEGISFEKSPETRSDSRFYGPRDRTTTTDGEADGLLPRSGDLIRSEWPWPAKSGFRVSRRVQPEMSDPTPGVSRATV
jgi:hypothetical protein